MVKEHRELDRTGTRKGHIVIKVRQTHHIPREEGLVVLLVMIQDAPSSFFSVTSLKCICCKESLTFCDEQQSYSLLCISLPSSSYVEGLKSRYMQMPRMQDADETFDLLQGTSERLTMHLVEEHSVVDPTFIEDFLLTYRTFLCSPMEVGKKLLEWFNDPSLRDKVGRYVLVSFQM